MDYSLLGQCAEGQGNFYLDYLAVKDWFGRDRSGRENGADTCWGNDRWVTISDHGLHYGDVSVSLGSPLTGKDDRVSQPGNG